MGLSSKDFLATSEVLAKQFSAGPPALPTNIGIVRYTVSVATIVVVGAGVDI